MAEIIDSSNYYNLGSKDDLYLSASGINEIDPFLGGHPKKFLDFLSGNKERELTKSLEQGNLFHDWMEREDQFIIADLDKPSDKIALIMEELYKQMPDLVGDVFVFHRDLIDGIRRQIGYYNNRSIDSVFKDIINAQPYYNFLQRAEGKIILDPDTRVTLVNCKQNFNNRFAPIFLPGDGIEMFKELALTFTYNLTIEINGVKSERSVRVKCKLDYVRIDHNKKIVFIFDYKTTKTPAFQYAPIIEEQSGQTSFEKRKVYRQLAIYSAGLNQLYPGYTIACHVIPVHTIYPYESCIFHMPTYYHRKGINEFSEMAMRVLWHYENDVWDSHMEEHLEAISLYDPNPEIEKV